MKGTGRAGWAGRVGMIALASNVFWSLLACCILIYVRLTKKITYV